MPARRAFAPAKINLYLHVLGRRADGYHLLDSLVAFARCGDEVQAAPADALTLELAGPFAADLASEPDNLVLRAARAMAGRYGVNAGAALRLVKNLPVASGIGGGSADAAAALRALARLWRIDDPPGLMDLARSLGADVPACLDGRPCFVGGAGERIDPAPPLPGIGLVLANPRVALATPAVFGARAGPFSRAARFAAAPADARALVALLQARRNDLTAAATALVPAIGQVLDALAASPGCRLARMSGSGATCFGIYDDPAAARRAAARIAAAQPRWWVQAAALVDAG